ncbi:TonB-dependent receptor [Puia dinghuensis]|uniref:TonB-dependent receptor n=1 Tax=Puia dinghuensis TaxID=1792502 RepID=A0A8J2XT62_9BACT|nr:TonB-dependent receptor [Puia dinghuensis]GGB00887.1 TonB-dependent receptor [Puia dinghuensis]
MSPFRLYLGRTGGPSAEGQTLAFCGKCATFAIVHFPHIFLWLAIFSLTWMPLAAQKKGILYRPFHSHLQKGTIGDFLTDINTRSGITVEYASGIFPLDKEVTAGSEIATLGALLQTILAGQHVKAIEKNDKIILIPSPGPLPEDALLPQYSVYGIVGEEGSREPMADAVVWEPATRKGTVCNIHGYYSLSLPEGRHRLEITHTGYNPVIIDIDLHWDQRTDAAMTPREDIPEVIVSGRKGPKRNGGETIVPGQYDPFTNFLGENDAIRSLYILPGVTNVTDASSGLLVRGGEQDENLFLLDGNPIFNPTHMLGALSIVDKTSLKAIQFYKSDFPSRFGGGLSSVIDVYTKDGNMQKWGGETNVNFLAASTTIEGPLKKDRTAVMASFRHSMPNFVLNLFEKDFFSNFYDAHFKVTHLLNRNNKLTMNVYSGEDNLNLQTSDQNLNNRQRWGNRMASIGWTHVLGSQSFVTTSVNVSHYYNLAGFVYTIYNDSTGLPVTNHSFNTYSSISHFNLRTQFEVNVTNDVTLKYGGEAAFAKIKPFESKVDSTIAIDPSTFQRSVPLPYHEFDLYAESEIRAGARFLLRPGIHFSSFHFRDFAFNSFQPRFYMTYRLSTSHQLFAAYNRMTQYLHLVTNPSLGINSDLWVPSTPSLQPEESQTVDLGYSYKKSGEYSLGVDVYWKEMKNVTNYAEGKSFFINTDSLWEQNIETGKGRSYGFELMGEKTGQKLNIHLSYALSWNWRQFDQVNHGREFPFKYDRRHVINLATTYKVDKSKDISALWMFATGDVYSLPERIYPDYDNAQQILHPGDLLQNYRFIYHFSGVNQYRTPPYSRFDLSVSYHPPRKRRFGFNWTAGVYNVFGSPSQYSYGLAGTLHSRSIIIVSKEKLFNITPYISMTVDY